MSRARKNGNFLVKFKPEIIIRLTGRNEENIKLYFFSFFNNLLKNNSNTQFFYDKDKLQNEKLENIL